jgi:hypothetical protein
MPCILSCWSTCWLPPGLSRDLLTGSELTACGRNQSVGVHQSLTSNGSTRELECYMVGCAAVYDL